MSDFRIEVQNLREVRAALRQVETGAGKELAAASKEAANVAAPSVESLIPRRTGRTASTVRPFGTQTGGGLRAGGAKAPHFGWLDFGGKRPRDRSSRPRVKAGRYMYPGIERKEEAIVDTFEKALDRLLRRVGLHRG